MDDFGSLTREYESRASKSQGQAAQAMSRLLQLAENRPSGQIRPIARFLAMTYDSTSFPWDPADLRTVDVEISDDMLACLDALHWGRLELHKLVPDGERRILAVCKDLDSAGPGT